MFVFLYMLAAMGVAYWAKLEGRNPFLWFGASLALMGHEEPWEVSLPLAEGTLDTAKRMLRKAA